MHRLIPIAVLAVAITCGLYLYSSCLCNADNQPEPAPAQELDLAPVLSPEIESMDEEKSILVTPEAK